MNATLDIATLADNVRAKNPNTLTSKTAAASVVKDVFIAVLEAVQNGDEVRVHGFGTFSVGERAARMGRNPQTGAALQIPASKVLKFKPSKSTKKGALSR